MEQNRSRAVPHRTCNQWNSCVRRPALWSPLATRSPEPQPLTKYPHGPPSLSHAHLRLTSDSPQTRLSHIYLHLDPQPRHRPPAASTNYCVSTVTSYKPSPCWSSLLGSMIIYTNCNKTSLSSLKTTAISKIKTAWFGETSTGWRQSDRSVQCGTRVSTVSLFNMLKWWSDIMWITQSSVVTFVMEVAAITWFWPKPYFPKPYRVVSLTKLCLLLLLYNKLFCERLTMDLVIHLGMRMWGWGL